MTDHAFFVEGGAGCNKFMVVCGVESHRGYGVLMKAKWLHKAPRARNGEGFTLLELLITITIVGILVALAVPSFKDTFERRRVKTVAETVASDLRLARSEAIVRGPTDSLTVEFTISGSVWSYEITDSAGATVVSRSSADFYQGLVGLTVSNSDFGDADTDSNRDFSLDALRGLSADGNGTVVVASSSSSYSITIRRNLLGKVDMCSSSFGEYPAC